MVSVWPSPQPAECWWAWVKLKIVPGATVVPQENKRNGAASVANGPGGRGRAEQDPVVQRMREKFGAQIRTVIDYREKR